MASQTAPPLWYRPTLDGLMFALVAAEVVLWLADWTRLPLLSGHKGWAALTTVAGVASVILAMAVWWLAALLLRWRFQFGIRTLLVLTVAAAVSCGWIVAEVEHARWQRQVVEEIEAKGGWVRYDYQFYASGTLALSNRTPGPAWLRRPLGDDFFRDVVRVSLSNTVVDDTWLMRLGRLNEVRMLWLDDTALTDAGLDALRGLPRLQILELDGTRVTDAGAACLGGFAALRGLFLGGTRVTDAGLTNLKQLANLEMLNLNSTAVTDAGVDDLKALSTLKWLGLINTGVTLRGAGRLQGALPNCRIQREGLEWLYPEPL